MKLIRLLIVLILFSFGLPFSAQEVATGDSLLLTSGLPEKVSNIDVPFPPMNLRGYDRGSYVSLTWEQVPPYGPNGYFVNPKDVYYLLYRANPIYSGGKLKEWELVYLKKIRGARTDYDVPQLNEGSIEPIYFAVSAENSAGESPVSIVGFLKGLPLPLPYIESFAGGMVHTYVDVAAEGEETDDNDMVGVEMTDDSADGDGGALALYSFRPNTKVVVTGCKINVATVKDPMFDFKAKRISGSPTLEISVLTPDGTRTPLLIHSPGDEYNGVSIDMSGFRSQRWVRLEFAACFGADTDEEEGSRLHLDHIWAHDLTDTGLSGIDDIESEETGIFHTLSGYRLPQGADAPRGEIVIRDGRKFLIRK